MKGFVDKGGSTLGTGTMLVIIKTKTQIMTSLGGWESILWYVATCDKRYNISRKQNKSENLDHRHHNHHHSHPCHHHNPATTISTTTPSHQCDNIATITTNEPAPPSACYCNHPTTTIMRTPPLSVSLYTTWEIVKFYFTCKACYHWSTTLDWIHTNVNHLFEAPN